jgi:hypothetical protein
VAVLLVAAVLLLFSPTVSGAAGRADRLLRNFVWPFLAIIPLALYALLSTFLWHYLKGTPADRMQPEFDRQQTWSLTLCDACFTSLGLLVGFFKDEIKAGAAQPTGIIFFFAVALGCFAAAHMVLRYRTRNAFGFVADSFVDNGLWCVLVGLWVFTRGTTTLGPLSLIFLLLGLLFLGYLALHFYYCAAVLRRA